METHMKECLKNNGKIVKYIALEKFSKPFAPHITSNMTYRFLLAHNREAEYKPTQYYITQRISTQLQKIEGRQYQILIPTAVSSTIKTKQCVKQMLYDQSQEDFIEKWFDRLFIEAKQVKLDNKFDDDIPQRYEVPVIGYDCLKSATTLIFRNLNSDKYNVIDFPGSSTCPKHIIVKSTENSIHLKFLDAKNYVSDDMSFDDFINDFGNEQPADNIIDQSRQLLYAIDNRINDYFQYKIDMLSNTSLAKLSCLEKYAFAYKDFKISDEYNLQDNSLPFILSVDYWLSKENSYNEQDKRKKRRIHHNIAEKDYEYFKNIFMNERCHMCQAKFTDKNKPTLDRIDNDKSRTKTNVKPCCLYCNRYASNKDKEQARQMIQLRKFCQLHSLPMTISDQDVYDLLRKDMVGGNSFVMHRENIAGETRINKFQKINQQVISQDLPHIANDIICLDFNSFYASCMSSVQHPLIPYTNHRMYMPGEVKQVIHDKQKAEMLIYNENRFSNDEHVINKCVHLFIAQVKVHIPEEFINEFINFPVIWRNLKITTNSQTIGEYTYENMIKNNMQHDKDETKLMMLLSTHDQFMSFNNYYLWFLIDRCHLVIDEIKQVIVFTKYCAFNDFVKTNVNLRCKVIEDGNHGEQLKCKLTLNTSFGYDSLNTEKYQDFRLCNKKQVWKHHMANTFLSDREISDNLYIVELEKKRCSCSTPLQVAYFTMDNSKYFYLNSFYNFLTPCLDMDYIHVIYGDTDSLCLARASQDWPIKNKQLWDQLQPYFFNETDEIHDKKKILGWNIESQASTCYALAPKCYYLERVDKNIMKLKGVTQNQNTQINKQSFQENITSNAITRVNNTSLIQKRGILSNVVQERIGISGINTKTIVLRNQSCAPFIYGINSNNYIIGS